MNKKENQRLVVTEFYKNWVTKDIAKLKKIYSKKLQFGDPIFSNLDYSNTIKMWKMLFSSSSNKKLEAESKITKVNHNQVWAKVKVKYSYGKKQHKVTNNITTIFTIENSQIIKQVDTFDFNKWINQAFGIKKNKSHLFYKLIQKIVKSKANKKLRKYH